MGRVLLPSSFAARQRAFCGFYLIDWGRAELSGFSFWDLVSVSISLGIPRTWVRCAAGKHCEIPRCEPAAAASYLVRAIADLRRRLEPMPVSRFTDDADRAQALLHSILPPGGAP